MSEEAGRTAGLFGSLRRASRTLIGAVRVRLDLVASEIEEQGLRLAQIVFLAVGAFVCLVLTALLLIALLVVVFWDTHRLLALGGLAAFFAVTGFGLIVALKRCAAARPKFLAATVAELEKDRQALGDPP